MRIRNTHAGYGWAAIALHWISAVGVTALYLLGERMEEAVDRPARLAAREVHVEVGFLLLAFLVARILWSAYQVSPRPLERNRALRLLAKAVQGLFLAMIVVLVITGPLAILSAGREIPIFDLAVIPAPPRVEWLHDLTGDIHGWATKLFWPLVALHVAGALKHVVIDRDATLTRMLWPRRT